MSNSSRTPSSILLVLCLFFSFVSIAFAQDLEPGTPEWESLLWGGKINLSSSSESPDVQSSKILESRLRIDQIHYCDLHPVPAGLQGTSITAPNSVHIRPAYISATYDPIILRNIPPLYVTPALPGEGIWTSQGLPSGPNGETVMWRTSYRPSIEFPNAIVHMLMLDMKKLDTRLYIGSTEPGGSVSTSTIENEFRPQLLAVTNALWKQKHSGDAGSVYRGNIIKPLAHGMATIVVYKDGSVDILEWNETIPMSLVQDARQLRHLIVKDGKVIDSVVKGGKQSDSEIGLGMLLVEEPAGPDQMQGWWQNPNYQQQSTFTSGDTWFIATRSAFGIRKDGNVVFAAGHHISTKDLAKALVLAGCDRAIHADANPHNVLGNLYYQNGDGTVIKRAKLSPEQRETLNRYDKSYTSDFFGFFIKLPDERNS